MSRHAINGFSLWATEICVIEIPQEECQKHNEDLIDIVVKESGINENPDLGPNYEIKVHNLHKIDHPSVSWLLKTISHASRAYVSLIETDIEISLRAVILRNGMHINTHTEMHESDLMVAYWPTGNIEDIGTPVNQMADRNFAPTFVVEDPSRSLSDLRLPWETRHSVMLAPRPGMMVIGPNHVPHNLWPYFGSKPFIHIVAQIKIEWPAGYADRW
jgi:hypothetical protein